ncbi:hypothetical protein ACFLQW_03085 [Candidatus Zixiibacteriota bacterium]
MRNILRELFICSAILITSFIQVQAGQFNRDNYYHYLPASERIVSQTWASEYLKLYGDTDAADYRDIKRVDGIDDTIYQRLMDLVERFSPVLYRRNHSVPRDFEKILRLRYDYLNKWIVADESPHLYVDVWDRVKVGAQRDHAKSYLLTLPRFGPPFDSCEMYAAGDERNSDQVDQLRDLLREFDPRGVERGPRAPDSDFVKVLYFDTPGTGERSWRDFYRRLIDQEKRDSSRIDSKIYAHPLIHAVHPAGTPDTAYEFVIQYWFFYPFNDGGNNHEGDWEHINVRLASTATPSGLFSTDEIRAIINPGRTELLDSLVLGKVDYYFHHYVVTLEYPPKDTPEYYDSLLLELEKRPPDQRDSIRVLLETYRRTHPFKHKSVINTHPVGYIGGDNMGLDEVISPPGIRNRDSHGTYPFPGIWKAIGPLGATEAVQGNNTYQFSFPEWKKRQEDTLNFWYVDKPDKKFLTYDRNTIILVPDWERVVGLAIDSTAALDESVLDWSWLILPIHWGFPISESKFAGIIKRTDFGNVGAAGPAFNSAWNRVGAVANYQLYNIHFVSAVARLSPFDGFLNKLGWINMSVPLTVNSPVIRIPLQYLRFIWEPVFFPNGRPPVKYVSEYEHWRVFSFDWGWTHTKAQPELALILPHRENPLIMSALTPAERARVAGYNYRHEDSETWNSYRMAVHLGANMSTENSLVWGHSALGYSLVDTLGVPLYSVNGRVEIYDIRGSIRWNWWQPAKNKIQFFLRGGIGMSFYKGTDITFTRNSTVRLADTEWIHNSWLPNTWTAGIGSELLCAPRWDWLCDLHLYGVGIRAEYSVTTQRRIGSVREVPGRDRTSMTRHQFQVGVVLSQCWQ